MFLNVSNTKNSAPKWQCESLSADSFTLSAAFFNPICSIHEKNLWKDDLPVDWSYIFSWDLSSDLALYRWENIGHWSNSCPRWLGPVALNSSSSCRGNTSFHTWFLFFKPQVFLNVVRSSTCKARIKLERILPESHEQLSPLRIMKWEPMDFRRHKDPFLREKDALFMRYFETKISWKSMYQMKKIDIKKEKKEWSTFH